jgi:hypothetical protein
MIPDSILEHLCYLDHILVVHSHHQYCKRSIFSRNKKNQEPRGSRGNYQSPILSLFLVLRLIKLSRALKSYVTAASDSTILMIPSTSFSDLNLRICAGNLSVLSPFRTEKQNFYIKYGNYKKILRSESNFSISRFVLP